MPHLRWIPIPLALVCCACSGGGSAPPPATGGAAATPTLIGSRDIPTGSITVHQVDATTFTASVGGDPVAVAMAIAPTGSATGTTMLPATAGAQGWQVCCPAQPPAGSHLIVQVTQADGDIVVTGPEDFPLNRIDIPEMLP